MTRRQSYFGIGFLGFALAAVPVAAPTALSQARVAEVTYCVSAVTEPNGNIAWSNTCNFPVTVKWFDQGSCSAGCSDYIFDVLSDFNPTGSYSYGVCPGQVTPTNFDALNDNDWYCPA